ANMITMVKKGKTRIPPGKVVPLARLLNHDPGTLLRHWFSSYEPDVLSDLECYFGTACPDRNARLNGSQSSHETASSAVSDHRRMPTDWLDPGVADIASGEQGTLPTSQPDHP